MKGVLAIDVGGSHVKVRIPEEPDRLRFESGSDMTAILTKLTLRTFRPRGDTDDCIDNYANENRDISEHWPKYIEF